MFQPQKADTTARHPTGDVEIVLKVLLRIYTNCPVMPRIVVCLPLSVAKQVPKEGDNV